MSSRYTLRSVACSPHPTRQYKTKKKQCSFRKGKISNPALRLGCSSSIDPPPPRVHISCTDHHVFTRTTPEVSDRQASDRLGALWQIQGPSEPTPVTPLSMDISLVCYSFCFVLLLLLPVAQLATRTDCFLSSLSAP